MSRWEQKEAAAQFSDEVLNDPTARMKYNEFLIDRLISEIKIHQKLKVCIPIQPEERSKRKFNF